MPSTKTPSVVQLAITGMSCASCVKHVEDALKQVEGVRNVAVNLAERCAIIDGDTDPQQLIHAVYTTGKKASILSNHNTSNDAEENQQFYQSIQRSGIAAIIGIPLMLGSMFNGLPQLHQAQGQSIWFTIGILTAFTMFFSGKHFYVSAWQNLKHGISSMDTLISLGTGTAWLASMVIVSLPDLFPSQGQHLYFEASLMILAFINLGHALEMRARGKTSAAIRSLIGLQARTARLIRDGHEIDIAIEAVEVGDVLRVRPGEKVAVDGIVIEGQSDINESMISGEAMSIIKKEGDLIIAGTINGQGSLTYQALHVGSDTILAKIIQMVRSAQATKPKMGKLADQIAAIFVPCVVAISIITAIVWLSIGPDPVWRYALLTSMTVLIIACPCALGLATPISIIAGIGRAAQFGILIRNGEALEKSATLQTIILDKTGTITEGKPQVSDIIAHNINETIRLAAALETHSEHPLAQAIIQCAQEKDLQLPDITHFQAHVGMGITATLQQHSIAFGNLLLMQQQHVTISQETQQQLQQLASQAKTTILLAKNKQLLGIIAVADPIKKDAKKAIQHMQQQGLRVLMFSGDQHATAQAVAQQVGVDEFMAELHPQDKLTELSNLQQQGQSVAMVGDGINDAPALAQANVGFAMGAGTDVAIEAADITLIQGRLSGVVSAIHISRATIRNIRQNLFAAFIYNIMGIPIAAGVLYPWFGLLLSPMIAGAAMAASSLTVVLNANRIRNIRVPNHE